MKITVITPTIRSNSLGMNKKCLERQTLKDFEWVVVSPFESKEGTWIKEPPKKEGDYYGLNKAWNEGLRYAKGELIVFIVDLLWFPPETLEHLWLHYQANPKVCVGLLGNQYIEVVNGKPENLVWQDPRQREENFYKIPPYDLELCLASIPKQGIYDVGAFDEEFDKFPAWSEKEMCCRMEKLGYTFKLDESVQYRALKHPRLNEEWDKKYPESYAYFQKCYQEIQDGKRLKLDYLPEKCYKDFRVSSENEVPA